MILQKVEITFIEYLLLSNLHFKSISDQKYFKYSMHFVHLFYHPIYR